MSRLDQLIWIAVIATSIGALVPVSHTAAQAVTVGCAPVVGFIPDSLGYVNAQGAASCSHPSLQTASVKVTIAKNGRTIESASKTCSPKHFSGDWCLSPYASAPNYAARETFCATISIRWKNESGGAWNSDSTQTCAVY